MDFIQLYANFGEDDDDMTEKDESTVGKSDSNFIDDSNISADENFYRAFENVDRDLEELVDNYLDWLDQRD